MTTKQITNYLFGHLRASTDLLIPRYTPRDWWECDVWRLTKAGFVDEFEIKQSVTDFRADANKAMRRRMVWNAEACLFDELPAKNKHETLRMTSEGPNRFWFVVQEDMVDKITVPEFAGLLSVGEHGGAHVRKKAPERHRNKWAGNRTRLLETFYHRYWTHESATKTEVEPTVEPV